MGPSLGPLLGGFSVPVYGWRWTQWELLWLAGPVLIFMLFTLPETSAETILLRRAKRLRKATGNQNMKSQSEIDQAHFSVKNISFNALVKPWQINALDPAVLFTTFFTGLIYGIFYTFFEVFPIVYGEIYHFTISSIGLSFLTVIIAVVVSTPLYMLYFRSRMEPRIVKFGNGTPEFYLAASMWTCWLLPAGLFIFGESSIPSRFSRN